MAMRLDRTYFQTPKHLYFAEALEDAQDLPPLREAACCGVDLDVD